MAFQWRLIVKPLIWDTGCEKRSDYTSQKGPVTSNEAQLKGTIEERGDMASKCNIGDTSSGQEDPPRARRTSSFTGGRSERTLSEECHKNRGRKGTEPASSSKHWGNPEERGKERKDRPRPAGCMGADLSRQTFR